jgi:hypothetical protein
MRHFLVSYMGVKSTEQYSGATVYGSVGIHSEKFVSLVKIRDRLEPSLKDSFTVLNILEFRSEEDYNSHFDRE